MSATAPTDATLLSRMANGDRAALAALYDQYAALLLGVAVRLLRDATSAEDLVHDVMLEVWRHAEDYTPERGTVRTWLLVRLRSRALDRLRSPVVRNTVGLDASLMEIPAEDASESGDFPRLRSALGALSAEQRRVLELAYFEGLSSSSIAERLGIPVGTVKSRTAAALRQLRGALGEGDA